MLKTKNTFLKGAFVLPKKNSAHSILIYDQSLLAYDDFKILKKSFVHTYEVSAGESLKDFAAFPGHMEKILSLTEGIPTADLQIYSAGGGSVGDFCGFMASTLRRGVLLKHIPTTWLSAVDSAHGGKTALNVGGFKNQIGSFYPATENIFIRKILEGQGDARRIDMLGEVLKISLLNKKVFRKICEKTFAELNDNEFIWQHLALFIDAKMGWVKQDPLEKNGIRAVLNLGHTVGHAFESGFHLQHGFAVALGVVFAVRLSLQKKVLSRSAWLEISKMPLYQKFSVDLDLFLQDHFKLKENFDLNFNLIAQQLQKDKKKTSQLSVKYIFLKSIGQPLPRSYPISEIVQDLKRQCS